MFLDWLASSADCELAPVLAVALGSSWLKRDKCGSASSQFFFTVAKEDKHNPRMYIYLQTHSPASWVTFWIVPINRVHFH